jgi:hypothetical protein
MTNETEEQEQERKGEIDSFYGQPIGSRRLEIEKLRHKLFEKLLGLFNEIHDRYKDEHVRVEQSPLGRIVYDLDHTHNLFDRSDHENMLDASDSLFRNDSDPVLSTVLDESVYKLDTPGHTKRERKRARHRLDIFRRRLQKHVYERYLSEAVGKPITVEEYEREFGFLSGVNENSKNT